MRHLKTVRKLGRTTSHRGAMLSNLATSLIVKESVKTTEAYAKGVRPLLEHMITFAKRGDLHARRQVLRVIRDGKAVAKLFDELAPRFVDREGGYTRIVKLGQRRGDGASLSIIQLVDAQVGTASAKGGPAKAAVPQAPIVREE